LSAPEHGIADVFGCAAERTLLPAAGAGTARSYSAKAGPAAEAAKIRQAAAGCRTVVAFRHYPSPIALTPLRRFPNREPM